MRKKIIVLMMVSLWMLVASTSMAAGGYPWKDHAFPYTFEFGNDIDTHQQTKVLPNGELFGFFYITFTGNFTDDGFPIAKHCDADTPPNQCVAGWILRGIPCLIPTCQATLVFHSANDHPIWLVNRSDIPQPGSYAHFHWLNAANGLLLGHDYPGYFLELQAIDTFAFSHGNESIPVTPGIDIATHVNIVGSFPR